MIRKIGLTLCVFVALSVIAGLTFAQVAPPRAPTSAPASSVPSVSSVDRLPNIAAAQVTPAPNWGNYKALPGIDFVENINVVCRLTADGKPDLVAGRAEYRKAFAAYKLAGAKIGFYISADVFESRDPFYPLTQMTPDPTWRWGVPRVARKNGLPVVQKYEDGVRWTMNRADSVTFTRLAQKATACLRANIADAGVQPDFIFFDNCGLLQNGGSNTLDVFVGYAETVADKLQLPFMVNVSATPDLWTVDEWEAVTFTAASQLEQRRWLGFAFETSHKGIQLQTGPVNPAEAAAYARLAALGCPVIWNVAAKQFEGDERPAACARLAAIARPIFKPGVGPYVDTNWFQPLPTWATE